MSEPTKIATPRKLRVSGRKLWVDVTGRWALRADELRVLEDACRERDLIDKLDTALATADMYLKGSMGQQVLNGLFAEVRQHRATFASLMRQLALPDDAPASEQPRSVGARKAAQKRWDKSA